MTDGIGRIFGGNSYGVGGYVPQRKEQTADESAAQHQAINHEETQVDPNKVMEFMASNNFFVAPTESVSAPAELDAETKDRISGYMERFEMIYGIVQEEFGEELAPAVMDLVMDTLMAA